MVQQCAVLGVSLPRVAAGCDVRVVDGSRETLERSAEISESADCRGRGTERIRRFLRWWYVADGNELPVGIEESGSYRAARLFAAIRNSTMNRGCIFERTGDLYASTLDILGQRELLAIRDGEQLDARIRLESQRLAITPAADFQLDLILTRRRPQAVLLLLRQVFRHEQRLLRVVQIPDETVGAHTGREGCRSHDPFR